MPTVNYRACFESTIQFYNCHRSGWNFWYVMYFDNNVHNLGLSQSSGIFYLANLGDESIIITEFGVLNELISYAQAPKTTLQFLELFKWSIVMTLWFSIRWVAVSVCALNKTKKSTEQQQEKYRERNWSSPFCFVVISIASKVYWFS